MINWHKQRLSEKGKSHLRLRGYDLSGKSDQELRNLLDDEARRWFTERAALCDLAHGLKGLNPND